MPTEIKINLFLSLRRPTFCQCVKRKSPLETRVNYEISWQKNMNYHMHTIGQSVYNLSTRIRVTCHMTTHREIKHFDILISPYYNTYY